MKKLLLAMIFALFAIACVTAVVNREPDTTLLVEYRSVGSLRVYVDGRRVGQVSGLGQECFPLYMLRSEAVVVSFVPIAGQGYETMPELLITSKGWKVSIGPYPIEPIIIFPSKPCS